MIETIIKTLLFDQITLLYVFEIDIFLHIYQRKAKLQSESAQLLLLFLMLSELRSPTLLNVNSNRPIFGSQSGTRLSTVIDRKQLKIGQQLKNSQIRFKYKPGQLYNLINRDLKLRNESQNHIIKFAIQCNNPLHYRVHPAMGDILPGKTIEIIIQINGMQQVSEIGRSFFAKFASDRFQITWYYTREDSKQYDENLSKIRRPEQLSKILTVSVEYNEEKTNQLEEVKKEPAQIETQVQETLSANRKELARLQSLISQQERTRIDDKWINTKLMVFLGFLAFLAGAVITF